MTRLKYLVARVALAATIALSFAAHAASVDLQVRSGDRVRGTIRPTFDSECFLGDLPKNAVLTAAVKGASKAGPAFQLAFRQGAVDVPGPAFAAKGLGGTLKPLPVASSGQYQVCVFVDDGKDGEYDLSVSWKPQLLWTRSGGPLATNDIDTLAFSAPAGATATIDVLPGRGSKFKGAILDVTGPAFFDFDVSDDLVKRFVLPGLPTTGDYAVNFTNIGEPGTWTARVRLKLPRFRPRKFDLRDTALGGAFSGDHTVFGRVVDVEGGTVLVQTSGGSPIDGSSVSIPADSLGAPVVITVSAGPPIDLEDGSNGAGPAVEFGPSGTTFDPTKLAQITIPFDPEFFPDGDTSGMVIYVRAADGTVSQAPLPYSFNGNTVTFSASHFSAYQAGTTNPRPFTGEFLAVDVQGELAPNFEGSFGFGLHRVNASEKSAYVENTETYIEWLNFGTGGGQSRFTVSGSPQNFVVSVKDDAGVQLIDNQGPVPETVTLVRGVSDDVFIGRKEPLVVLRKAAGRATPALLAGAWHLFHVSIDSEPSQSSPPAVELSRRCETGVVTFTLDGKILLGTLREIEARSSFPTGKWTTSSKSEAGGAGVTYAVFEGGQIKVTPPDGDPAFDLEAVLDGNVLVGFETINGGSSGASTVGLYVLVRKATGQSTAKAAGVYRFVQHLTEFVDYPNSEEPPKAQDVAYDVADYGTQLAANGVVTSFGTQDVTSHQADGTVLDALDQTFQTTGRLVVRPDGSIVSSDLSLVGAMSIGGGLVVLMDPSPTNPHTIAFGIRVADLE